MFDLRVESDSPWSSWSDFGGCSLADCTKYRQRFCTSDNKQADCPGADYYGIQTDVVKCSDVECYGKKLLLMANLHNLMRSWKSKENSKDFPSKTEISQIACVTGNVEIKALF